MLRMKTTRPTSDATGAAVTSEVGGSHVPVGCEGRVGLRARNDDYCGTGILPVKTHARSVCHRLRQDS